MLANERNRVNIKSNTIAGVKLLFKVSLYLSHSVLYPPAEHNVKLEIFSTVVSVLRKVTTKSISNNIMVMP